MRRIWSDITRGENVDLYVTIFVALVAGVMNLLGIASQSFVNTLIMAVLFIIAISLLVNRYKFDDFIATIHKPNDTWIMRQMPLGWTNKVAQSNELWVVAISATRLINEHYSILQDKARHGHKLKFLLVSPLGISHEVTAIRRPQPNFVKDNLALIQTGLSSLCHLKRLSPNNSVEIRVIDYPVSTGIIATDPNTSRSEVWVQYYPFKTSGGAVPIMNFRSDNEWHEHFLSEWQNLWDSATPWDCDAYS